MMATVLSSMAVTMVGVDVGRVGGKGSVGG